METLTQRLAALPNQHRVALEWFAQHAGTEVPWPAPLEHGTLLATRAKGIYKPSWTQYALSVRQTLSGPYADRDPVFRTDGTWSFSYYQENPDPSARDTEYANRGLMACLRDKVPVGVMRQISGKPQVRYHILGVALVAGCEAGTGRRPRHNSLSPSAMSNLLTSL